MTYFTRRIVFLLSAFSLIFLLSLNACSGTATLSRRGIDPKPNVRASSEASDAFVAVPAAGENLSAIDREYLGIKTAALDKEFLLSASVIPQTDAPTSSGLQGRVVAFRRYGNSVFVLEATQGHVVTRDLPASLILAELPIIRETADELVLDFNAGMKKIFAAGNWYSSPDEGAGYKSDGNFESLPIARSYLESITVENDRVVIRQIAQVDGPKGSPTAEARYFISPYLPDPSYEPRETSDFTRVGYFEVAPRLEETSGRNVVRISKWNHRKPVTYSISANTPAEYVQAVREGILYWNKVFGSEVLRAEMAPAGAVAPDSRHNIIQWVPWDSAGFAYADALMDPRSGEILNAQVYLTSAFAFGSKLRMGALLRRLRTTAPAEAPKAPSIGLKQFRSSTLCAYGEQDSAVFRDQLASALENLIATGADDATLLRVSQDYVRLVTAHEVGHTLGLRHNFAGSLSANGSLAERDRVFSDYVLNGKVPSSNSLTLTSSVMDYLVFEDDVLSAAQMSSPSGQMTHGFSYDRNVIGWGYEGKNAGTGHDPFFCTDGQVPAFADCQRFDSGAEPVTFQAYTASNTLKLLPITLVETFIGAKAALDPRDRKPLEQVGFNPAVAAAKIADAVVNQAAWLGKAARSIWAERQFANSSPLFADEILAKRWEWAVTQISANGGVDQALLGLLPATDRKDVSIVPRSMAALDAYLSRPEVRNGIGQDGKPYSLSDDEVQLIRKTSEKYFVQLDKLFREKILDGLAKITVEEPTMGAAIESRLGAVAEEILFAEGTEMIPGTQVHAQAYDSKMRMRALQLLKGSLGTAADYSMETRARVEKKLIADCEKATGKKFGEIKELELAKPLRLWFMEQKELLSTLGRM